MHFDSRGVGAYFLLGMAAFFLYRKRVKQEKKKFNAFTPLWPSESCMSILVSSFLSHGEHKFSRKTNIAKLPRCCDFHRSPAGSAVTPALNAISAADLPASRDASLYSPFCTKKPSQFVFVHLSIYHVCVAVHNHDITWKLFSIARKHWQENVGCLVFFISRPATTTEGWFELITYSGAFSF